MRPPAFTPAKVRLPALRRGFLVPGRTVAQLAVVVLSPAIRRSCRHNSAGMPIPRLDLDEAQATRILESETTRPWWNRLRAVPWSFRPQQEALPPVRMAQLKSSPAVTVFQVPPPATGVGLE